MIQSLRRLPLLPLQRVYKTFRFYLRFSHSFCPPLTLSSIKDLRQQCTSARQQECCSPKHDVLAFTALLLRHIPLDLSFRRRRRVRGMLQRTGDLPLPLHAKYALSYAVIDLRELATSHFGANHILYLDRCEFQLICTRSSAGSRSLRAVMNAPIRESRTLSSSVIRYTGVRIWVRKVSTTSALRWVVIAANHFKIAEGWRDQSY
jgi:hypothetical protein